MRRRHVQKPPQPSLPHPGAPTTLPALTVILICQLFGEVLVRGADLPMPGPVLGMGLLLAIVAIGGRFRPEFAFEISVDRHTLAAVGSRTKSCTRAPFSPARSQFTRWRGRLVLAIYNVIGARCGRACRLNLTAPTSLTVRRSNDLQHDVDLYLRTASVDRN